MYKWHANVKQNETEIITEEPVFFIISFFILELAMLAIKLTWNLDKALDMGTKITLTLNALLFMFSTFQTQLNIFPSGELVSITTDDGYFVLSFDSNAVANATEEDTNEDGVESAFDVSCSCTKMTIRFKYEID